MKRIDLKQGAIVQLRDGSTMILIGKVFVDLTNGDWFYYYDYTEDLIYCYKSFKYDIVKVFNPYGTNEGYKNYLQNNIKWTWERKINKYQEALESMKKEIVASYVDQDGKRWYTFKKENDERYKVLKEATDEARYKVLKEAMDKAQKYDELMRGDK